MELVLFFNLKKTLFAAKPVLFNEKLRSRPWRADLFMKKIPGTVEKVVVIKIFFSKLSVLFKKCTFCLRGCKEREKIVNVANLINACNFCKYVLLMDRTYEDAAYP